MTEDVKKKFVSALFDGAWALGEVTAIRAVGESNIRPFYKWNLLFVLFFEAASSIGKASDAIDEFVQAYHAEKYSTIKVPESEES